MIFFLFTKKLKEKVGGLLGGGGGKGYVGPTSQIIGGGAAPLALPLPTPILP